MSGSEAVARVPLTDAVHDRILEMIMDGTLAPGEPLRVVPLAERMGVSPTPVRESLGRLAGEGIIDRAPMRGYTVAPILDSKELTDLFRTRLLLECEIAAGAAGVEGLDGLLADNLARTRNTTVGATFEEYRDYLDLSAEFHRLIANACDNRFLSTALAALPVHLQRFRLFGPHGVDDFDESLGEHEAIREALASGDPQRARDVAARHIRGVAERSGAGQVDSRS
jgi:DNA-binding GntR family transcriptional regulator